MKNLLLTVGAAFFVCFSSYAQRNLQLNQNLKQFDFNSGKVFSAGDNGSVSLKLVKSGVSTDDIKTTSNKVTTPKCLTKEQVRGQKIESEIIIADGSKANAILPGAVISADDLLNRGEYIYYLMDKRKPIALKTNTNQAVQHQIIARPPQNGMSIETPLNTAVQTLINPSNIKGEPIRSSNATTYTSTMLQTTGLNIGASFFYMGAQGQANFNFSSEKYKYMYVFNFEQECISVRPDQITSPNNIFTENVPISDNLLYISEVKYGRRLYVILESEYDLTEYDADFKGSMNWGALSAKVQSSTKNSTFRSKTKIRALTQGGSPIAILDESKIQEEIDKYLAKSYSEYDIVPLSYKLTDLSGKPVSLSSTAFLNGNNCVKSETAKIRIKSIELLDSRGDRDRKLYGEIIIKLSANGQPVNHAIQPMNPALNFKAELAPKSNPETITQNKSKEFVLTDQKRGLDIRLPHLDILIEVIPNITRQKNNAPDLQLQTNNVMKKTVRRMLLDGTSEQVFELNANDTKILLTVEIVPM
jgi:hypothetical protein